MNLSAIANQVRGPRSTRCGGGSLRRAVPQRQRARFSVLHCQKRRAIVRTMSTGVPAASRPYSHELLDADHPPLSALKERLSIAVVGMLASTAGLDAGEWGMDYDGRDVTLSSSHDYSPDTYGPSLDLQMKCTGQQRAMRADHVAWQLDARTTTYLAAPNRHSMAVLCVVVVPKHPGHWLDLHDEGLLAYCRPYFLRGQDLPQIPHGQTTHVVHLPFANLLTAPVLLDLMAEAARWRSSP